VSVFFFFSSRRRHTRFSRDWSSDVCSSDLNTVGSRKFAARGGAWSQLLLGAKADNQTAQRKLLTNRRATVTGASTVFGGSGNLRSEERRVGKECRSQRSRNT